MSDTHTGEAYCMKCKKKQTFTGTIVVNDKGGRVAKGTCPVCGTKMNAFLKKA